MVFILGVPASILCMLSLGLKLLSPKTQAMSSLASLHVKARLPEYPGATGTRRLEVPDDKVSWSVEWVDYKPAEYTAPVVKQGPVWADPDIKYNKRERECKNEFIILLEKAKAWPHPSDLMQLMVRRIVSVTLGPTISSTVVQGNYDPIKPPLLNFNPLRNPAGRTGMTGRGLLGKWGPNHAADPVVTR